MRRKRASCEKETDKLERRNEEKTKRMRQQQRQPHREYLQFPEVQHELQLQLQQKLAKAARIWACVEWEEFDQMKKRQKKKLTKYRIWFSREERNHKKKLMMMQKSAENRWKRS